LQDGCTLDRKRIFIDIRIFFLLSEAKFTGGLKMAAKRFGTEERRRQIAEAALAIVGEHGVRGLSTAAVAQKVGIGPSALYRHFRNKDAIVDTVLELIKKRLCRNFQDVTGLEISALDKLRLLFKRHIEFVGSNNAIPRIIFSGEVIGGSGDRRRRLYGIIGDVIGKVAAIVGECQREGTMRADVPPESIAVSFLGMIQPAAIIWDLSDGEFDLAQHGSHAWQLFLRSVQPSLSLCKSENEQADRLKKPEGGQ
jgi:AcrR family transcriptional regulator